MVGRKTTQELVDALQNFGIKVCAEEVGNGDTPDTIRLKGDAYLIVDYEDFERIGIVHVLLNEAMYSGGDSTIATWMFPSITPEAIASQVKNFMEC